MDVNMFSCMPLISFFNWNPLIENAYWKAEEYILQFRTDPAAIKELLPECAFKVGEKPIVTVVHDWFNDVGLLEGDGYAISAFAVSARFDGEKDHVEGDYVLIMPETNNFMVMTGREYTGTPKILSDIAQPLTLANGFTRVETRTLKGEVMYGVNFAPLKETDAATRQKVNDVLNSRPLLNYAVHPRQGCDPDAYPLVNMLEKKLDKLWMGTGEVYLGDVQTRSTVMERNAVNALKTLPVLEVIGAMHWIGAWRGKNEDWYIPK